MTMQVDKARLDEMLAGIGKDAKIGTNSGHGHVWKRPDGRRMRCGGPGMCAECSADAARLPTLPDPDTIRSIITELLELRSLRSTEGKEGAKTVAVPVDPTDEMIAAGVSVDFGNEDERATVINVWHAMVAARAEAAEVGLAAALRTSPPEPASGWVTVTDEMVEAGAQALSKMYHGDNKDEPFGMMARKVLIAALSPPTKEPQ